MRGESALLLLFDQVGDGVIGQVRDGDAEVMGVCDNAATVEVIGSVEQRGYNGTAYSGEAIWREIGLPYQNLIKKVQYFEGERN